jgi:hypothetical protein
VVYSLVLLRSLTGGIYEKGFIIIRNWGSGIRNNDLLGGDPLSITVIVKSFGVGLFLCFLSWGLSRTGSMYSRMLK